MGRTRLTARNAKATEDLRTKVEKVPDKKDVDKTDFNLIRRPLCDAVFEEWYFKKLLEYKMKKAEEELAANREVEYKEEEKKELEAKSEEAFKDWLREKKALAKKMTR